MTEGAGGGKLEIRALAPRDIPAVCGLFRRELGYDIAPAELEAKLRQMDQEQNYRSFVAELDGNCAGFLGLERCLAFEIPGWVVRIIALAVSREFQGQGVGGKLLEQAETWAAENGASLLLVNSGLARSQAHRFYENHGYTKKGYSFCKQAPESRGMQDG